MTTRLLDQLTQVLGDGERLVAGVQDGQWTKPTPCTYWTVRDLVNHLVGGHQLVAGIVRGEPLPTVPPPTRCPRRSASPACSNRSSPCR